jgi:hypothetical protein
VSLPCDDAVRYLYGSLCRRIARSEASSLPWVDGDDLLQAAATDLFRHLRRRCPCWADCPLHDGRTTSPCTVGNPGHGEQYVKAVLRSAVRREWGTAPPWPTDEPWSPAATAPWSTGSEDDPPVDSVIHRAFYVDRLRSQVRRLRAGTPAGDIWPGVRDIRIETKVDAARLVLTGVTTEATDALRLVDRDFYGDPDQARPLTAPQRQRVARDGRQVVAMCRAVWHLENDG